MDCSFAPDMSWFIFDTSTGKTIKGGFKSKGLALAWMAQVLKAQAEATVH